MRKVSLLLGFTLAMQSLVTASHGGGHASDWWLLVFTLVLLAGLAIYIYYRVHEAGLFTFIPHTAMEENGGKSTS